MLRQSAEADGSVIQAPDGGGEWRYEGQKHPLRQNFSESEFTASSGGEDVYELYE